VITTQDIVGYDTLGPLQKEILVAALENAQYGCEGVPEGVPCVDGLDAIIRSMRGGSPAVSIGKLEELGYLVTIGTVPSSGRRPSKRHKIVVDPGHEEFTPTRLPCSPVDLFAGREVTPGYVRRTMVNVRVDGELEFSHIIDGELTISIQEVELMIPGGVAAKAAAGQS